jgi:hypothetical protein
LLRHFGDALSKMPCRGEVSLGGARFDCAPAPSQKPSGEISPASLRLLDAQQQGLRARNLSDALAHGFGLPPRMAITAMTDNGDADMRHELPPDMLSLIVDARGVGDLEARRGKRPRCDIVRREELGQSIALN